MSKTITLSFNDDYENEMVLTYTGDFISKQIINMTSNV